MTPVKWNEKVRKFVKANGISKIEIKSVAAVVAALGMLVAIIIGNSESGADSILVILAVVAGCFAAILVIMLLVYIPIREAKRRNHPQADAIAVCAWLSIVLWPLWFVAIIWSYTSPATTDDARRKSDSAAGHT